MRRLAEWRTGFGTLAVSDVPHVDGGEAAELVEHVAKALERWRECAATLIFLWKKHLDGFRSPKAFALVSRSCCSARKTFTLRWACLN